MLGVGFEPEVSHGYPKLSSVLFFSITRFELLSGILQEALKKSDRICYRKICISIILRNYYANK